MRDLLQDIGYSLRSLRRSPGFTVGVVLTLTLGLGVNMAMFSFLDVVFLRPPAGVAEPDQVRRVWTEIRFRTGSQFWSGFSYPQYSGVESAVGDRAETALYLAPSSVRYGTVESEATAHASYVTNAYFNLLGVRPALGRFFTEEEDELGSGAEVALASYNFWQRELGGDRGALGRELLVNGRPFTLVGIVERGFNGVDLDASDLWIPIASQPMRGGRAWWHSHSVNGFQILVRPHGTISDDALEERLATGLHTGDALRAPRDTANAVRVGSIITARGPGNLDQEVRIAARIAGVTGIVLLIACANVINLLMARAVRRRREIAVRLAMGVSRLRLARLILTETLILSLAAALGAVAAASWGGILLRTLLLPEVNFGESAAPFHWRVGLLALSLGVLAGLVAGLLPVIQSLKTEVTGALKAGGSDVQSRRSRVQPALVVVQAALSVVLLVGAGLFIQSLRNIHGLRTGYDAGQLVFGAARFDTRDSVREANMAQPFLALAQQLRGSPGVEELALVSMAPTRGFRMMSFHPDVDTTQYPKPFAPFNVVSPGYFSTMGMRLLSGTDFPNAVGEAMPRVVIVNEAMAKAQWPGMEAIGHCMRFGDPAGDECYTVIGVVETAMFDKLLEEPQPQYYLPMGSEPKEALPWFGTLVVKARPGAAETVSAQMRQSIRETFPGGRASIETLQHYFEPLYRPWRLGALLFTTFGLLAFVVAAIGIYSTVAYGVAQRTREFGVRAALGARAPDILRQVVGGSLRSVIVGVLAGVALSLAGGRLVASLLYGIEPGDPAVMVAVGVLLLGVAAAAAAGPAWTASRVDPASALRSD